MKRFFLLLTAAILFTFSGWSQSKTLKTDNLDAREVRPGFWVIQGLTLAPSTMYLIEGSQSALLIDTGMGPEDLSAFVSKLTNKPVIVALTHGHGDHSAGAKYFKEVYLDARDLKIAGNMGNAKILNLKEGQIFDLGGIKIETIAIPGHTPGSVAFLDRTNQCIFTGDGIGSGSVWMQLGHSLSLEVYLSAVKKVEAMLPSFKLIWYGHEEQLKEKPAPAQYLADMKKAAERILAGETGEASPSGGNDKALALRNGTANIVYDPGKLH